MTSKKLWPKTRTFGGKKNGEQRQPNQMKYKKNETPLGHSQKTLLENMKHPLTAFE